MLLSSHHSFPGESADVQKHTPAVVSFHQLCTVPNDSHIKVLSIHATALPIVIE